MPSLTTFVGVERFHVVEKLPAFADSFYWSAESFVLVCFCLVCGPWAYNDTSDDNQITQKRKKREDQQGEEDTKAERLTKTSARKSGQNADTAE
eukprot:m.20717 g.20717  ORF g.20717 m.20717 type:complete len:94 (+) comp8946_c0_seq1:1038-1319(+)